VETNAKRLYTRTHEWVCLQGDLAVIGLTEFAVKAVQDIVFLELPPVGEIVSARKPLGVVESVKAVFDLNSPLDGKVVELNSTIEDDYSKVASDPYGEGWLLKIKPDSELPEDLMNEQAYADFCALEEH
jgi:glycine cleavage system H protein